MPTNCPQLKKQFKEIKKLKTKCVTEYEKGLANRNFTKAYRLLLETNKKIDDIKWTEEIKKRELVSWYINELKYGKEKAAINVNTLFKINSEKKEIDARGTLDFRKCPLKYFPTKRLSIFRELDYRNCFSLMSMDTEEKYSAGSLLLDSDKIDTLPSEFLFIIGSLDISKTNIKTLPDNLFIHKDVYINKNLEHKAKKLKAEGSIIGKIIIV